MKIICPAGIGDFSWMWSKLWHVRDEIHAWRVVDGAPRRTAPYMKACGIMDADYDYDKFDEDGNCLERGTVGSSYESILVIEQALGIDFQSKPTWKKIRKITAGTGAVLPLEANRHLEAGWPLGEWLPDLPTNYHYPVFISEEDKAGADKTTERVMNGDRYSAGHPMTEGPVVGISCASYRGAAEWRTWGKVEWVDFLERVMKLGWRPLMVGGGWDDLTYAVACELDLPSCVGRTSVPQMIHQMDTLDSYIGYSSGMNVIRTVLNRPAMALWPCNDRMDQSRLMWSWAPPHMIESGRYVAVTWKPVDDVWPVAKRYLQMCEKELNRVALEKEAQA